MDFFDIFQLAEACSCGTSAAAPFRLALAKKGLPRLLELILLPRLVAWMLAILCSALHIRFGLIAASWNPLLVDSLPLKIVGVPVILFGDFVWALLSFGDSWRNGIDESHAGELVTGGIFAFTRNPLFVFIDLYFIGTFLASGTLISLFFATVTAIGMHFQILQEEKFLSRKYGQAYQDYRSRTGRYFGLTKKRPRIDSEKAAFQIRERS